MTAGEVVSHTWRTKVVFRIPVSRWVLEGLACLVLHVRVKNQAVWGLACLVTYVLVNSYNIVVFLFFSVVYVYIFIGNSLGCGSRLPSGFGYSGFFVSFCFV